MRQFDFSKMIIMFFIIIVLKKLKELQQSEHKLVHTQQINKLNFMGLKLFIKKGLHF